VTRQSKRVLIRFARSRLNLSAGRLRIQANAMFDEQTRAFKSNKPSIPLRDPPTSPPPSSSTSSTDDALYLIQGYYKKERGDIGGVLRRERKSDCDFDIFHVTILLNYCDKAQVAGCAGLSIGCISGTLMLPFVPLPHIDKPLIFKIKRYEKHAP